MATGLLSDDPHVQDRAKVAKHTIAGSQPLGFGEKAIESFHLIEASSGPTELVESHRDLIA